MTIKNIFFPTDFSGTANKAFLYALLLAEKWQAEITTFHVYNPLTRTTAVSVPVSAQRIYDSIELEAFENYRDSIPLLREMAEDSGFGNIAMQHVMVENTHVIPTILEGAKKEKADMIVLGTTGAGALKEIFLGSVAGEVLERAQCPVLAVPGKGRFSGEINDIAFTTNYQEEEKRALVHLLEFADVLDARIHCINVDTSHTHFYHKRMEKLQAEFGARSNISFEVLDGLDLIEEIIRYLDTHDIDVLAMVTHKRPFLQELFNFSKAKRLSYHSSTPILSFPEQAL